MTGAALQGLHTAVLGRRAIYLEETDSTNRYLKEAGESLPHGTLCYTCLLYTSTLPTKA